MKAKYLLIASALTLSSLAQTVYTIPQGYTRVEIAGADANGPSLTAISASLLQDVAFSGQLDLGNFSAGSATVDPTHQATSSGAGWSTGQFTNEPHLAYIQNEDGAEEAFLITAHTSDTLTLSTTFDLEADSDSATAGVQQRFPSSTSVKIRKANTVASLLGTDGSGFASADRIFLWDGSTWEAFRFIASNWREQASFSTIVNDMVVYPDQGIFALRTEASPITLTLFGEVPSASQISTVPGTSFVSTRVPIDTTLNELGIQNDTWTSADRVFIWSGSEWTSNRFVGGEWRLTNSFTTLTGDQAVPANSALFVNRATPVSDATGETVSTLPYTID